MRMCAIWCVCAKQNSVLRFIYIIDYISPSPSSSAWMVCYRHIRMLLIQFQLNLNDRFQNIYIYLYRALITKRKGGHHTKNCKWNKFSSFHTYIYIGHTYFVCWVCFNHLLFILSVLLSFLSSYHLYRRTTTPYKMVVIAYKKMCHFWQFCWRFIIPFGVWIHGAAEVKNSWFYRNLWNVETSTREVKRRIRLQQTNETWHTY